MIDLDALVKRMHGTLIEVLDDMDRKAAKNGHKNGDPSVLAREVRSCVSAYNQYLREQNAHYGL